MVDTKKPMAKVEFNGTILLNVADATKLFELLCVGEHIEYDYNSKGYKRKGVDKYGSPTLTVFTLTDYASLALNTETE